MGLLCDNFCLIRCKEFAHFVKLTYFSHKQHTEVITSIDFLTFAKAEYRTLYIHKKWDDSKSDSDPGLYVGDGGDEDDKSPPHRRVCGPWGLRRGWWGWEDGCGGRGGQGDCNSRGGANGECHNCCKWGHYSRDYWALGGGIYVNPGEWGTATNDREVFPGVDKRQLRSPPRNDDPFERESSDSTKVKWCNECGFWGKHFWAGHTAANAGCDDSEQSCGEVEGFRRLRTGMMIELKLLWYWLSLMWQTLPLVVRLLDYV